VENVAAKNDNKITLSATYAIDFLSQLYKQLEMDSIMEDKLTNLQSYGCWCRKFNNLLPHWGGEHISGLDWACKELSQCRRCNSFTSNSEGKRCTDNQESDVAYFASYDTEKDEFSCEEEKNDECAQNRCLCDMRAAGKFHNFMFSDEEINGNHIENNIYKQQSDCPTRPSSSASTSNEDAQPQLMISGDRSIAHARGPSIAEDDEADLTDKNFHSVHNNNFSSSFHHVSNKANQKCCGNFPEVKSYNSYRQQCVNRGGDFYDVIDL